MSSPGSSPPSRFGSSRKTKPNAVRSPTQTGRSARSGSDSLKLLQPRSGRSYDGDDPKFGSRRNGKIASVPPDVQRREDSICCVVVETAATRFIVEKPRVFEIDQKALVEAPANPGTHTMSLIINPKRETIGHIVLAVVCVGKIVG